MLLLLVAMSLRMVSVCAGVVDGITGGGAGGVFGVVDCGMYGGDIGVAYEMWRCSDVTVVGVGCVGGVAVVIVWCCCGCGWRW